jgi:hypothetical protein
MAISLRNIEIIFLKIKYVMRTFSYKKDITEDYIISNAIRGVYFYQLTPYQKVIINIYIININRICLME